MIYVVIPGFLFVATMVWIAFVPPLMAWPVAHAANKLFGEAVDQYDAGARREVVGMAAVALTVFLWLLCVLAPAISITQMLEGH